MPFSLRESEFLLLTHRTVDEIMRVEIDLHSNIVDAIARHDSQAAQEAMEAHMRFEEDIVRRTFASITSRSA